MPAATSTTSKNAAPPTTTAPTCTNNMSLSTTSYQDPRMAPPAQEYEHEHHQDEYKDEHHQEYNSRVPLLHIPQDEEELLTRIRAQVDFYFSPQNLAQDHFLCSLLTSYEHYGAVPVQQICGFPKIRQIVAAAIHSSADKAQLPPADPDLLYRAVAHKSDRVRVVGDAATGYWFVPFTLPDHTNYQTWFMSSPEQQQQQAVVAYPNRSQLHGHYPQQHPKQQQQQHARMVSGPPPPPSPSSSSPKKSQTSPTTMATTSFSASVSLSSSTSGPAETASQGIYQQQQHSQQQQHAQHPVVKERTVVLVHDIPDARAQQDIWQLFSGRWRRQDNNGNAIVNNDIVNEFTITTFQPKSVVQDVGRTWHVTFGSEKEAKAALLASRGKMYRDIPIRAGLENDSSYHNISAANNNYGMQYSYRQQQQLQPYWQDTTHGNAPGENHYYMNVQPPMPYGTVQHAYPHTHSPQQYSYGYAVMPPIIMSPPVMVPGMYAGVNAGAGPPHQMGYVVPADYTGNGYYQYAGAVPASPPPPLPVKVPPPQQAFVRSNQPSSNEDGNTTAVVGLDNQEESTVQAKSSSQDTATTATVDGGGSQKNSSRAKKWTSNDNNNNNKGDHKYQSNGGNQSLSGDSQKEGDGQHTQHRYQGKKGRTSGYKSKKKEKQRRDNAEASRHLTEEHFPALGGLRKKKAHDVHSKPQKAAYAEALLKPPVLASVPSGEPTGQTRTDTKQHNVERQMKELCLSEQGPSQQSSEQKPANL